MSPLLLPLLLLAGCPAPDKDTGSDVIFDTSGADTVPTDTGEPPDADGDGFPANVDCDDRDPGAYPGAAETWYDGVDQDCDGGSDFDADRDGQDATSGGGLDCDDASSTVHVGASEVCGNGVDDDCDGTPGTCRDPFSDGDIEDAPGSWSDATPDDRFGAALGQADTNADGRLDVLVGAPGSDLSSADGGATWVFSVEGPGVWTTADAAASLLGETAGGAAGSQVAGVGDMNADGFEDLVVGAPSSDVNGEGAGAVYGVAGPLAGPLSLAFAQARILGEAAGDEAGGVLSAAGDVTGDGIPDVLAGMAAWGGGVGIACIVAGPLVGRLNFLDVDLRVEGENAGDRAGVSVAGPGDIDGDGVSDLLVGAPGWNDGAGGAFLVLGPATGSLVLSASDAWVEGEATAGWLGTVVSAAGDVNQDGYDDVAIAAPNQPRDGVDGVGGVWLVPGPWPGHGGVARGAVAAIQGEAAGGGFGQSLAHADPDGDGFEDLVVGTGAGDRGAVDGGVVVILRGPIEGTFDAGVVGAHLAGGTAGAEAGAALASPRDLDGDGFDDLVAGAPGIDTAFLFLGGGGI